MGEHLLTCSNEKWSSATCASTKLRKNHLNQDNTDDTYCKMVFAPILIKDYRCSSPTYISPNITYLLDVAAIRKIDEIVSSTDGNMSHQFYKLVLLGDKNCVKLGKGTFVIPINISSPRMKTHNAYLKIYWCSDDFCLDDEHFSVEVISEKDFNSLKIN